MLYLKDKASLEHLDKDYDSIIESLVANTTPVKVGIVLDNLTTIYSYQIGRLVTIQFFCGRSRKMPEGSEILLMKDSPLPAWVGDSIHNNVNLRASAYLFWDKSTYILSAYLDGQHGRLIIIPNQTGDFGFSGQITYICRNS